MVDMGTVSNGVLQHVWDKHHAIMVSSTFQVHSLVPLRHIRISRATGGM